MKNKNKLLFSILKAGIFVSAIFIIAFLVLRTYEIKIAKAATITSIGSGDWHTAGTWDSGVPGIGDNVIIAAGHNVTFTSDIAAVANITIQNTGTLTQNNTNQQAISGTLTINSGGTLTHSDNTGISIPDSESGTILYTVNFSAANITVDSGGFIDVDGLGYDGATGSQADDARGPGRGRSGVGAGSGAGHGGDGGNSSGSSGGTAYCDISDPATIGSGGGDGYYGGAGSLGGDGGGLIILDAGGTVTINGTITADGGDGGSDAGGGSGGGVKISADIIAGTPDSFTTTGGDGDAAATYYGGGGGGGCILLEYATSTTISDVSSVDMYGGTNSGGTSEYGGAGQLLIRDTDVIAGYPNNGDLYIENNGTEGADSSQDTVADSLTVDSITLSSEANYLVPSGESFTVNDVSPFASSDGTGTIKTAGDFDYTSGNDYDNLTVSVLSGGTLYNTATINVTNDGGLTLNSGGTVNTGITTLTTEGTVNLEYGASFTIATLDIDGGTTTLNSYSTSNALSVTTLDMDGGTLTHADNSSAQTNIVNISATNIDIAASASIDVDELGYDGGTGSMADDAQGPGAGDGGNGNGAGSGAGHAGNGGDGRSGSNVVVGGTAYCDISSVATMGSGGGSGYYSNSDGGNGGGLIILNASGTATINGTITADAGNGASGAGGGSGGGVKITATTIAGTPNSFTATGGNGSTSAAYYGGGGGGGCILLEYTSSSSMLDASSLDFYGGTNSGGNSEYGGAGQLLIHDTDSDNGDLFVENNGSAGAGSEQVPSALNIDSVTVSSAAKYIVPNGNTMAVNDTNPFGGDDTGTLEISGILSYLNGTSYDNLDVSLVSGTLNNSLTGTVNITNDGGLLVDSGSTVTTTMNNLTTAGTLSLEYGASFTIATLDIDGGTTTLNSYDTSNALSITTLDMDGGTLTHGDNSTTQTNIVNVSATTIDIGASASVDVSNLGYDGGSGDRVDDAQGPGAGDGDSGGGGGAHGGDGGDSSTGALGGTAYCNISDIATMGSGGGSGYYSNSYGGAGGGLVILNASGTATINGTIAADAVNGVSGGGGGAGGGVKITATTIAGTPNSFTAIGGDGGSTFAYGGGGGGGCILLEYRASNTISAGDVSILGGSSGGGTAQPGEGGLFSTDQLNQYPTVSINSALSKTNGTGIADISIELDDGDLTDTLSAQIEYKAGADCSSGTSDPTIDTTPGTYSADSGTPTINNAATYQVSNIPVVDTGSNTVQFDWLSQTDVSTANGTYCVRVTPYDGTDTGTPADSTFTLDNVEPVASGNLTESSIATDSITYTLGAAGSDTNLSQYRIYYKEGVSGVTETDTLGATVSSAAYAQGNTVQISGLSINTQYVANIWTYDSYGNSTSATELIGYTQAEVPGQPAIDNLTTNSLDVTLGSDNNPTYTTYAIRVAVNGSNYYLQADGTLGSATVWQTKTQWGTTTVTGLNASTTYTASVKARNGDNVETTFSTAASGTTEEEGGSDTVSPTINNIYPEDGAVKIKPNTNISFSISDSGSGVDIGTLWTTVYGSWSGRHKVDRTISGDSSNYEVTLDPKKNFHPNERVILTIQVRDYAENITRITNHTFYIIPTKEPTIETLRDEGKTEVWRAQSTKTEQDIQVEQSQGIVDDGASIAIGDLTYDGTKEIVTAPKAGLPYIRIYSKEGFLLTPPFLAYESSYTKGVNVAIGDLHGTEREQEIITSPMDGTAHIRIFNKDGQVLSSFFARDESFSGNSIVRVANLEGSDSNRGELEIIILFSDGILKVFNKDGQEIMPPVQAFLPGLQNAETTRDILFDLEVVDIESNDGVKEVVVSDHNTIMIYGKDQQTQKLKQIIPDIIPFEPGSSDYNQGIVLSIADLEGTGGEKELVVGSKSGSSIVRIFNKDGQKLKPDFYAYDPGYHGGIDLRATDLDGTSGPAEVVTIAQNYSAHVRIFNKDGEPLTSGFMAYPEGTDGKTKIQAVNLNNDELQGGSQEKDIVVVPIQGPTNTRFYSKDSELLTGGFYIVGVGTKIEIGE